MEATLATAIVEYNPITSALASVEKYRGLVCDVTTPKGLAEAKAAQREVAALRIALEKTRKKVKEDVLARSKLIDGEANRIFALIAAIEDPIKTQIEAAERREQEAREAAIKAEQDRLAAEERAKKEAEEKRLAEERAKLAADREALEKAQAVQREAEEKARREREEADRQARAKIEEEERAARQRIEAAEAEARAKRQAEEDRQRQVREEAEEKALAERHAKEEAEREERIREQERMDGYDRLRTFVKHFGHLEEFQPITAEIQDFLSDAEVQA
jgi:hypothetical protein